jgi:multidrug efflux pump
VPEGGPPTGKAIQIQLSAVDPAGLADVARRLRRCSTDPASSTFPTACRRRASTGRSRSTVRRLLATASARLGRHGRAACDNGSETHRLSSGGRRRRRRYPAAAARGPAHAVDARRSPDRNQPGFGPDLEFRHPRAGRKRWNADRIDGVRTITVSAGIAEGIQADPLRQGIVAELEKADLNALGIRWKLAGRR